MFKKDMVSFKEDVF